MKGGAFDSSSVGRMLGLSFVMLLFVVMLVYVVYHVYRLLMSTALRTHTIMRHPKRINRTATYNLSEAVSLSEPINGKEFSYSFWMYIEQFDTSTANKKHIISRGSTFEVHMGENDNSMEVQIKKEQSLTPLVMKVDYIPVQRWVNIVVVVDNEFVTLYMDGDIHTVVNVEGLIANTAGEIILGAKDGMPTVDMIMSNIKFFNYAITVNEAKVIYNSGPSSKNVLGLLGLPMYGVRNPFYRIDTIEEVAQ